MMKTTKYHHDSAVSLCSAVRMARLEAVRAIKREHPGARVDAGEARFVSSQHGFILPPFELFSGPRFELTVDWSGDGPEARIRAVVQEAMAAGADKVSVYGRVCTTGDHGHWYGDYYEDWSVTVWTREPVQRPVHTL